MNMQTTMNKYDYEAKISREKRENERRKTILIMILRYLVNLGYADTAFKLQEESSIEIDKYDVADNMDLYMILCEYEEYFELKFNRKPKFVTQVSNKEVNRLPSIKQSQHKSSTAPDKKSIKIIQTQKQTQGQVPVQGPGQSELKLELVGQSMNNNKQDNKNKEEKFTFNDQKESILLKPFPETLFGNNEMKELAGLVKK